MCYNYIVGIQHNSHSAYPVNYIAAGEYGVQCALIIGRRKESTDKKTSLNDCLRDFAIS